jgi:DNA-binding transcriptional ArsR family regulator
MCYDIEALKAISDATRLSILHHLIEGEKCACELIPLVKKTQSTVSIHLGLLEKNEIIISRREGRKTIYSVKDKRIKRIMRILEIEGEGCTHAKVLC